MNRAFPFFLGVLLAANLYAAPVEVRGSRTCRHWQDETRHAKSSTEMNKVPLLISKSWFLGYLSGRAEASGKNLLKGTDNDSLFLWLDNYCRDHPGMSLEHAGVALAGELLKQKQPQR